MRPLTAEQKIIRDALIYCARRRRTITYNTLGDIVGRAPQGPWAMDLDAIRKVEEKAGRPDLTWALVKRETGLPSRYMGKILDPGDEQEVESYRNDLDRLYECWEKIVRDRSALRMLAQERKLVLDSGNEDDRPPLAAAASRQERDDQDFIDAITDWDWGDR